MELKSALTFVEHDCIRICVNGSFGYLEAQQQSTNKEPEFAEWERKSFTGEKYRRKKSTSGNNAEIIVSEQTYQSHCKMKIN